MDLKTIVACPVAGEIEKQQTHDEFLDPATRVPGVGMNKPEKNDKIEMTGSTDSNRSESQGGCREKLRTKEGRSKDDDRRNTNRQRSRVRAMSVLGNAKSDSHRKTHQVEPDGTESNMFMHLIRGDLRRESGGEPERSGDSLPKVARRVERSESNTAETVVVKRAAKGGVR